MDRGLVEWLMVDTFGLEGDDHEPPGWYARAACKGMDTGRWFPEMGGSVKDAVTICQVCDVRSDCLAFALDAEAGLGRGHRAGVWGGLTPNGRAALEREQAA